MLTKTETGEIKDVSILDVTPDNFICPQGEEGLYHCRIEVVKFNPNTGQRESGPRIQVFGAKYFDNFGLHNLKKQGYIVDILHDPHKWEAQKKAEAEAKAKAEAEAKAKAEAEAEAKAESEKKKPTNK